MVTRPTCFMLPASQSDAEARLGREPSPYEANSYDSFSYPKRGTGCGRIRYRWLNETTIEVEAWVTYCPGKNIRGVGGRAMSKLTGRYQMVLARKDDELEFFKHGPAMKWYYNGNRSVVAEYCMNEKVKCAEFNNEGRLISWTDIRKGEANKHYAEFEYDDTGKRTTTGWRGRFVEKRAACELSWRQRDRIVRRNDAGLPLTDDGDYTTRTYDAAGVVLKTEQTFVAGKEHGFFRRFNKYGRVIEEQYFYKGKVVPDWMYLDPQQVTPEEIQDEPEEVIREFMLDAQGEIYQARIMARSLRARQVRVSDATVPRSTELFSVRRPAMSNESR